MDSILKFILYARKHPEKELHNRYFVTRVLNIDKDFDWVHEESKCDIVRQLCTIKGTTKQVKATWKYYKNKVCYYSEFFAYAASLLREGKRRNYKPNLTDLLL